MKYLLILLLFTGCTSETTIERGEISKILSTCEQPTSGTYAKLRVELDNGERITISTCAATVGDTVECDSLNGRCSVRNQ